MMRLTWYFLAGLAVLIFSSTASAQFFTDGLSSGTNWTIAQTSDSTYEFGYDYSQDGLPPAPNGSDTIGLKFEVNNNEPGGIEQIGAFYGSELLTGRYTFRVDIWSNWALDGGGSGVGTTEFTGVSVGHDGFDPGPYGASFLYTGDGDASSIPDYSLYKDNFRLPAEFGQYALGTTAEALDNTNPILTAAFPAFDIATAVPAQGQSGNQQAGAAGFQWMTVNVEVDTDTIGPSGAKAEPGFARFSMHSARSANTVEIGTVDNSSLEPAVAMDTVIGLLMSDLFPSVDVNPVFSFGIYDNVQIFEGLIPLEPVPGLVGDYNDDGAVDAADYVVWRKSGGSPDGYNEWRSQFGQSSGSGSGAESLQVSVPEPTATLLCVIGLTVLVCRTTLRRR